jgi:hypothetical protein
MKTWWAEHICTTPSAAKTCMHCVLSHLHISKLPPSCCIWHPALAEHARLRRRRLQRGRGALLQEGVHAIPDLRGAWVHRAAGPAPAPRKAVSLLVARCTAIRRTAPLLLNCCIHLSLHCRSHHIILFLLLLLLLLPHIAALPEPARHHWDGRACRHVTDVALDKRNGAGGIQAQINEEAERSGQHELWQSCVARQNVLSWVGG